MSSAGTSGYTVVSNQNDTILSVARFSFSSSPTRSPGRTATGSSSGSSSGPGSASTAGAGDLPERERLLGSSSSRGGAGNAAGLYNPGGKATSTDSVAADAADAAELRRDIMLLVAIFSISLIVVGFLYRTMPHLPPADAAAVRLPRSMDQLRALVDVAIRYKAEHMTYVSALFSAVYIFLQMFAIPGAVFLSILAGPLFGLLPGIFIISTVATTGTTICYLLSHTFGRRLVRAKFPDLLASMQARVDAHRTSLLYYMFFLRVTPILPNWFINIASPVVAVPLRVFVPATFVGLMPGNYLHLSTGLALNNAATDKPLMTPGSLAFLFLVGVVALLPVLFKNRLEAYSAAGAAPAGATAPAGTAVAHGGSGGAPAVGGRSV